ncbi:DUF4174 domain-containing protein [Pseudoruegeria sp. SK021]|uniref:DUF4174 domain-containing protein n=1 Tax=Pseudoruegeria sp. SK021 TaxID=1933035 RepID=UPI000A25C44F|nr:DUF4174 domain-containing protein [Pseudoruegeria sp. SK021]OSP53836.1 hypothetical protein BV911_15850 [Pseudoruegeria sp. SK021]
MFQSIVALVILTATITSAAAQPVEIPSAGDAMPEAQSLITPSDDLATFLWTARPVVVFADTPNDPRFIQQMELLEARKQELFDRDVVVLVDTDPDAMSPLRTKLRPRGFSLVLLGKDGQVVIRKPAPWNVRELTRQIDKMPLRKQEVRDRALLNSGG